MDFSTFVISLGSSAMLHLGKGGADGATGEVNMPLARQTIDILAMLEAKTAGNLTSEEANLLKDVLYQCRVACLEAGRG